jgi:hypothetical protein
MSYDVSIADVGLNYTFNLSPLFYHFLPGDLGLKGLDGLTGKKVLVELKHFWYEVGHKTCLVGEKHMRGHYDSDNGWGSLVGAIIFMGELTAACGQYPRHTLHVDA